MITRVEKSCAVKEEVEEEEEECVETRVRKKKIDRGERGKNEKDRMKEMPGEQHCDNEPSGGTWESQHKRQDRWLAVFW